ncbi:MAG: response regulator [Candidatus Spechtbacterales bacterium]
MAHTILLVDDDADIRGLYAQVFKENGFKTLEAPDGAAGLEMAIAQQPDLVFTGTSMPNMDGFQLTQQLRANAVTKDIPVMISSHRGKPEDRQHAEQLGIKDFVVFNFTPPVQVVRLVRYRIEGDQSLKSYNVAIDTHALDARDLLEDNHIPNDLACPKHPSESLVLRLTPNPEEEGLYKARFVCPRS